MRKIFKGLQCVNCGDVMVGIFSFRIRNVCKECGGKAIPQRDKDKDKD